MNQRTIFITGTSRGIGKFLAEYYLKKDYTVVGVSRSETSIKHERYHHFTADISDEKSLMNIVLELEKNKIDPDILINNAGLSTMSPFILTATETFENVFKVNVLGTFLVTREIAKFMIKKRWGRIINISSIASPLKLEGESAYASSKSAVETLTKILAKELAPLGITCNCVGPALVPTDMLQSFPEKVINEVKQKLAIKKVGTPDEVAYVIDFFIGEKGDCISGQTIYLGGI